ncbi:hypothetical protein SAMN05216516_105189 [Izhakiella capsodis]|uniref:Uncharacterized protein n=1 Tax=Izhakiella capsodis TaxID=1367852 RepID=A0A1I4Y3S1_9GAMM|nr:hypothetical protein SAMN05216516_105189 [Izhakiella capsodis]
MDVSIQDNVDSQPLSNSNAASLIRLAVGSGHIRRA